MTEPRQDWLDELLRADAAASAYPPAPRFENPALGAQRPSRRPFVPRRFALAAAMLFVVVAILLALPDTRSAIADFLGLAVQGERIEILPTPAPGVTPTSLPTAPPLQAIASPIARADIPQQIGFSPQIPRSGEPDGYYVLPFAGVRVLVVLYPTYVLWETPNFIYGKGLPEGTLLKELSIRNQPAYWIAGTQRTVRILTPDGKEIVGTERTVAKNTLVWRGQTLTYRLEGDFELAEALAIADSLP